MQTKKDCHGFPLSQILFWAPLCIVNIVRDYVFLPPGTHLYPDDYAMRFTWDSEFYIVSHGEFRKDRRGYHVIKYKVVKCDFSKGFHDEMRILGPRWIQSRAAKKEPFIMIGNMLHRA